MFAKQALVLWLKGLNVVGGRILANNNI